MKKSLWILLCLALVASGLCAQAKVVSLTSLEWPPYTDAAMKDMGASAAVATAAFKAMGYTLKIDFYPWNRAVSNATNDSRYIGYFPEYYSKENEADFIYSASIGKGPLGFVERKDAPVAWSKLDDLKSITIGVVSGYINTAEFDDMVAAKALKVDPATDDTTNIVKVANKRIPLAVIDPNVLNYLLANDKTAIPYREQVQFNARTLEIKTLHVCFRKGAEGEKWVAIFNEGLKKINPDKIMQDYLDNPKH
jgi:polar amino acid transport system substrate-binding protein